MWVSADTRPHITRMERGKKESEMAVMCFTAEGGYDICVSVVATFPTPPEELSHLRILCGSLVTWLSSDNSCYSWWDDILGGLFIFSCSFGVLFFFIFRSHHLVIGWTDNVELLNQMYAFVFYWLCSSKATLLFPACFGHIGSLNLTL